MHSINVINAQNHNTAHQEKARLETSFVTQRDGTVIIRHEGRVKYLEEDSKKFLDEIKGKNEDQVRSVIRSRYSKQPAH